MRRIGMLTSGGDCQALNATMRGVAKSLYNMFDDVEIIGFEDGYKGLMYADYQIMKSSDFSGILTQGGTILGTSRQPFKLMRTPDENGLDKGHLNGRDLERLTERGAREVDERHALVGVVSDARLGLSLRREEMCIRDRCCPAPQVLRRQAPCPLSSRRRTHTRP